MIQDSSRKSHHEGKKSTNKGQPGFPYFFVLLRVLRAFVVSIEVYSVSSVVQYCL